jgi:butyrate kinase
MIQHTVAFRLHDAADVSAFLADARLLAELSGVHDFEVLTQVGKKNSYRHALSMWFVDQHAYDLYDADPEHQRFVRDCWIPNVAEFIELDYVRGPGT